MPAKTEKQRRAMQFALAVKQGKAHPKRKGGPLQGLLKMSEQQLKEFTHLRGK
jgi:hypothetical protein